METEVTQLLAKAETADSTPLQDGLTIQGEIVRRENRIAQLKTAREVIEARAQAAATLEKAERAAALAERAAREARGEKPRGRAPAGPESVKETPSPKDQYNYTGPESRIMSRPKGDSQPQAARRAKRSGGKTGSGFQQSYNAQAAVEIESRLIVGQTVSEAPNDKEQLVPTLASVPAELGKPDTVLTDSGFYSEAAVAAVEAPGPDGLPGTEVLAAVVRTGHHRSVADLEKQDDPPPPGPQATAREHMIHRTATQTGKKLYKKRQETVEPVFGIIKSAMGFRQFLLRGKAKVSLEWGLVTLAYNMRRLHRLGMHALMAQAA